MIRAYREEDFDAASNLLARGFAKIFSALRQQLGEELFLATFGKMEGNRRELLRKIADADPANILICEREGRMVGVITFYADPVRKIGTINMNAVDPECGEKGVGQEMYNAVVERCKKSGMKFLVVNTGTDEAHAPARRAYERLGMHPTHGSINYMMEL